ncbi:MAG: MFS transporter [Candidatus Korobacteraceae bacterium]|jgi:MFS family permease
MTPQTVQSPAATVSELERMTMRRVALRIVPFLMLCFVVNFIDRINVGMAALTMNRDIGLKPTELAFGVSLFFAAYVTFGIPSNLALERVGARRWMAVIIVSWGLVSMGTAFIVGTNSYYVNRFLLGVAEAGFLPGSILFMSYWFPSAYRAKMISIFAMAMPISGFIGSPISGLLLGMHGVLGIKGWQWLFLLEAFPAVLLGVITLFYLSDGPAKAKWLKTEERDWVLGRLEAERRAQAEKRAASSSKPEMSSLRSLLNPRVFMLSFVYTGSAGTSAALYIWQPTILKSFGLTNFQTGLITGIPFGIGCIGMVLWGRHSDRAGERVWHTAIPLLAVSAGLALSVISHSLLPTVIGLCIAIVGIYSIKGPFFALCTEWLPAGVAAGGIGMINGLGNIAGGVCPYVLAWFKQHTGSFPAGLLALSCLGLVCGVLTVLTIRDKKSTTAQAAGAGK